MIRPTRSCGSIVPLTPPSRLPMQLSSSGFVVASSRRPTTSCWARARQLGGRVAPAASTLSSRSRAGSERDKCPIASNSVSSRASLGVGPSTRNLCNGGLLARAPSVRQQHEQYHLLFEHTLLLISFSGGSKKPVSSNLVH
eukprot:scaffold18836_cov80-Phaeocystis_antarctica.AAC.4